LKGKDKIEQLFSDKLGNFEAKVDPSLWTGISSQLGAQTAATTSAGMSVLTKAIIGITAASIVVVSTVYLTKSETDSKLNDEIIANSEQTISSTINTEKTKELTNEVSIEKIVNEKTETIESTSVIEDQPAPIVSSHEEINDFLTEEVIIETEKERNNYKLPEIKTEKQTEVPEIVIPVEEEVIVEAEEIELYKIESLPNIFTPNGDGNNDIFMIESTGLTDFSITILNNQNKVVYQSNQANFRWNGLDLTQNQVAAGNYVYYITARDSAGNPVNKYSQLVLRR
jgi:gliding motility-associated-like protein